ncbi:MAG TPA: prefoldin subunit [archaeon]|nr:prefoldin subunit [archaeon]
MDDMNKTIQEFERSRMQLAGIESQARNLEIQSQVLDEAIKELDKSKQDKVYKAVGNILIQADAKEVAKDLKEQKETLDLRAKTVKKQEQTITDKLNKLKTEIEASQKEKGKGVKEAK